MEMKTILEIIKTEGITKPSELYERHPETWCQFIANRPASLRDATHCCAATAVAFFKGCNAGWGLIDFNDAYNRDVWEVIAELKRRGL